MTEMPSDNFFLCFGPPKSGTTFLQRMLNMHPQVSCPSEHPLEHLASQLDGLLDAYSNMLVKLDRRTGGQGATLPDRAARLAILRAVILELSRTAARNKPVHGLNDNALFFSMGMIEVLFGRPKIIAIVRNPVDLAVSTWRHNTRLAREEPEEAAGHLSVIAHPEGLEGFVLSRTRWYNAVMEAFMGHAQHQPQIAIVRYERLVRHKKAELQRLFSHLGVDCSDEIVDPIVANSSPAKMAARSFSPEFFGVSSGEPDAFTVSDAVRQKALRACQRALQSLGYDMADLL